MKRKTTWILVADGGKARIFESLGVGQGVRQVPDLEETLILPANRELLADRPGRSFASNGPTRHALDASDPHRALKRNFARHLVDKLTTLQATGAFDRLVLVAPPEMLGNLRSSLSKGLLSAVDGELARDLTHMPTTEISQHLEAILPV